MSADATSQEDVAAGQAVESQVEAEFRQSNYHALRTIRCRYENGVVSLFGTVPTFHLKQIAFAVARRSLANIRIDDRLRVIS